MAEGRKFDFTQSQPISHDDYDDLSDLGDLGSVSSAARTQKHIRRRSSKACDQCRKSKCKCERSGPGEPCKSCIALDTPCTSFGPSKKRGPPKGYIDAIEARLHQTEALLGIMLSSRDIRAVTLLRDIAKDPLAKEIINRVNNSPYGVKGRNKDNRASKLRARHRASSSDSSPSDFQQTETKFDLMSTHPSNDWQDQVTAMLHDLNSQSGSSNDLDEARASTSSLLASRGNGRHTVSSLIVTVDQGIDETSSRRRQRRRINNDNHADAYSQSHSFRESGSPRDQDERSFNRGWSVSSKDSVTSDEDRFAEAMGQLSLNEDKQVRYHGKASGLYLLGNKERVDSRNEGGIWRFPKAGVWPALPSKSAISTHKEDDYGHRLPAAAIQEHLLDLYFRHVHPVLPVIHKRTFFEAFTGSGGTSRSSSSHIASAFNQLPHRMPRLLLLAMFAIAARYSDDPNAPPPTDPSTMWDAGDDYLNQAKVLLDGVYTASRASTCQALLLMGYREIGIGAMAQAWTYIGMAIRMAQDLGMHRSADGWTREDLGGQLFGESELHERKMIWYTCVIMDKYVSTYIGRPLMIFDRDFDTTLPTDDDLEELESPGSFQDGKISKVVPGRILSCFNASARLCAILSKIIQAIYAVCPVSSRHSESKVLGTLLDKWYIELPEHLRYDPGRSKRPVPPPHVLTLHMQYWCTVLLLYRPFIRHHLDDSKTHKGHDDNDHIEFKVIAGQSHELCVGAANHITTIATAYSETYTLRHCPVFLCYYVFTASIMHVTSLTTHLDDPQARIGLNKCMEILHSMEVVWPSAGRALELLRGSKVNAVEETVTFSTSHSDRRKRSAEYALEHFSNRNVAMDITMPLQGYAASSTYNSLYSGNGIYTMSGYGTPSPGQASSQVPYTSSPFTSRMNRYTFSGPLSTSVLPQLYSTGLDDPAPSDVERYQQRPEQPHSDINNQYWNDYSTFSQLGNACVNSYNQGNTQQASTGAYPHEPYM